MTAEHRPNLLVILIYDLRFDEFGACGHPCMRTTHFDWLTRVLVRFDATPPRYYRSNSAATMCAGDLAPGFRTP